MKIGRSSESYLDPFVEIVFDRNFDPNPSDQLGIVVLEAGS